MAQEGRYAVGDAVGDSGPCATPAHVNDGREWRRHAFALEARRGGVGQLLCTPQAGRRLTEQMSNMSATVAVTKFEFQHIS